MIGMVSVAPPSQADIVAQAATLALPAKSKAVLKEISDQLAGVAAARTELAAMQVQIDADRAAADKLKAELDAHAQDLASREQQHNARAARLRAVADQFEQALGEHAAALEGG